MYLEEEKGNAEKSNNQGDIDSMQEIATRITRKKQRAQFTHGSQSINGFKNWKGSVLCNEM